MRAIGWREVTVTKLIIAGLVAFACVFGARAEAAESETAKLIGCWEMAQLTKCGRSSSKVCFGSQDRAILSAYVACEKEGFEERYSYKLAGGLLTLRSQIRTVSGACRVTLASGTIELSCDEAAKDFNGKFLRLCSKLNTDASDCAGAQGTPQGAGTADKIN